MKSLEITPFIRYNDSKPFSESGECKIVLHQMVLPAVTSILPLHSIPNGSFTFPCACVRVCLFVCGIDGTES